MLNEAHSPHIIVVGNEKGGAGKTTTAMHIIVSLLYQGFRVGSLDLDVRQQSLTRYIENRNAWTARRDMPRSEHIALERTSTYGGDPLRDQENFSRAISTLKTDSDFIVIDSPGADTFLSRLGHALADTLISPINDSFLDFDLLAHVDPETLKVKGPSIYSEMVWECRKARATADGGSIDWIVMRNRTSHIYTRNRDRVNNALTALSKRIGFRLVDGLSERVIFREMFPAGLTLLDLTDAEAEATLSMSHVAARAEVRQMVKGLALPGVKE